MDPDGLHLDDWQDNGDGTWTVKSEGAKLWDIWGADWQEKSGYEGDPTKLHVGDTVGIKKESHDLLETVPSVFDTEKNTEIQNNYSLLKSYGFGFKCSLIFGLGCESGIITDGKHVALYFTGSYGTGVQVSLGNYSNIQEMLQGSMSVSSLFSPSISNGIFSYGTTTSLTADIALGIVGTYDLNNLNNTGVPNSFSFGSVGGGVWYNSTTVIPLW